MAEEDNKVAAETAVKAEEDSPVKKGRGRPKKTDAEKQTAKDKKPAGKRGRPPKAESAKKPKLENGVKRSRGRPKSADSGKPKSHPPVAEMVIMAVAALYDRKGCSLSAVKKYIGANYKVDMERQTIFIRRYVRKCLEDGKLVLVKGTSSTGSFKLADPSDAEKAGATVKNKGTKSKRGRPKGSSKKKAEKSEAKPKEKASKAKPKGTGKRGRPKGSTKKKASKASE